MNDAVISREIAEKVLDALGLKGRMVSKLTLTLAVDAPVTVRVEEFMHGANTEQLDLVLREYKLVPLEAEQQVTSLLDEEHVFQKVTE